MNSKKTKKPLRRAKRWGARIWPMAGRLAAILAAVTVMGLMFSALQAVGSMALRAVISLAILSGVLLMLYSEGLTRGVADADAVDATAGATVTSNAIKAAVADCIAQAGGNAQALKSVAEKEPVQDAVYDVDVVVVGAGAAGLSAALKTAQNGHSVILLEKMGVIGGASAMAGSGTMATGSKWQKEDGYEDSAEKLVGIAPASMTAAQNSLLSEL